MNALILTPNKPGSVSREEHEEKRQLDLSLMGWLEMTFRQPPRFIEETAPFWVTPPSESELRRKVLSWARMLKARPLRQHGFAR